MKSVKDRAIFFSFSNSQTQHYVRDRLLEFTKAHNNTELFLGLEYVLIG